MKVWRCITHEERHGNIVKKIVSVYLKPYYSRMAIGLVFKFTGTIMDLCIPWILAYMIDSVIPRGEIKGIYVWGIIMLACSLVAVFFNVIANRMASKVASDATQKLRYDLFSRTMYLSNRQTDQFTKPSLISRLTTDTYNIHQMIGRIQRIGVRAPILLIGGILVTMTLDPVLSGILLLVMPVLAIVMMIITKKGMPLYRKLQQATDEFVRLVREDIAGIRVIKALSKAGYERDKFDKVNSRVINCERSAEKTMALLNPAMNSLLNLGLVGVIVVGAYRVNAGTSQVGKILAFMTYFTIILNAMMSISRMFVIISKAVASAARVEQVLETSEDMPVIMAPKNREDYFLVFEHVTFSYNGKVPDLEDISFRLKKGEMLGIIGATGAGKTTIASLLMRLYDISEGGIYIEGEDIRTIGRKKLRRMFGVVFQNDIIFEDTISANINLGRNLSEEDITEALFCAQAAEFTSERDGKEKGMLSIKGANLSGGQKQRVLIARALAAHPDILILDDSSSALDYRTDALLRTTIREKYPETTTIMIAQRVSSVMHADHILVLEEGRIIGYGTHAELLQTCADYQAISQSQMGA